MPTDPSQPRRGNPIIGFAIIVGLILFIFLNLFVYWMATNSGKPASEQMTFMQMLQSFMKPGTKLGRAPAAPSPTPSPSPKPYMDKPNFTFNVSMNNPGGPTFSSGVIEPFTPKPGETWKTTIHATSPQPITSITAIYKTDTKQTPVAMKLVSGTATQGTWEATWNVDDTYGYRYHIRFEATAGAARGQTEVSIRGNE